jgi:uncharacterized membrane protein
MSPALFVVLAFAVGVVAGLRAMTAPMVVSWAARLGWIDVRHTWAGFLGSTVTAIVLTVLAAVELVTDQLPATPARTTPLQFSVRVFSGAFSGAVLAAGVGRRGIVGVLAGAIGAVVGTLVGYDARTRLVRKLAVHDFAIALPEDFVAVVGGFLVMAIFRHW